MTPKNLSRFLALILVLAGSFASAQEGSESSPNVTESERLLRLEDVIKLDEEKLEQLKTDLDARMEMFDHLTGQTKQGETDLEDKKQELGSAEASKAESLRAEIASLEEMMVLGKKQSEIEYQAAKALQDQIQSLEGKLAREKQARDQMIGIEPSPSEATTTDTPAATPGSPGTTSPGLPISPLAGVTAPSGQPEPEASQPASTVETAKQLEARREAEKLAAEAQQAEAVMRNFLERKAALDDQIQIEKDLLQKAKDSRDNLDQASLVQQKELQALIDAGASKAKLNQAQQGVKEIQDLARQTRQDIDQRREYLDSLTERMDALQNEQLALKQEAEAKRQEAEAARKKTVWLDSPLHPQNLLRWARTRGPRMLLVVAIATLLVLITRLSVRRVARTVIRHGRDARASGINRADTLALSFGSAITVLVVFAGVLLLLQEAGLDIKTVLGGAAILGIAIAFGAQNLMRDYFTGFLILLEDQFELGDLVTIGPITGRVEKVNMRTTMLRDIEGRVHFIPNGEIKAVTNRTYVWGRAVVEVPVGYREDVDRVMAVILEVGKELRQDPDFGDWITEQPAMLGVDKFTEYGVVIKFWLQTKPDKMFPIRRELLRRIKNRFDAEGIQISVPHRVLIRSKIDNLA